VGFASVSVSSGSASDFDYPFVVQSFTARSFTLLNHRRIKINTPVIAVAIAAFSAFLHLYATQSLLPFFTQVFHASKVQVSLTVSSTTTAVALAAPLVGLLADMIGRKRIIVLAVLGLAIPTFMASTVETLQMLIVWRFVQGLFIAVIFSVTIAYISEEWSGAAMRQVMAAYIAGGNIIGGVAGRFLSGLMATHFSWQSAFVMLGSLNLLCFSIVLIWLPQSQQFYRQHSLISSMRSFWMHLRNPRLLAAYAVAFNILFANVSTFTYINFHLAAPPFNLGTTALGSVFSVYLLGSVITPIVGKWFSAIKHRIILTVAIATSSIGVLMTLSPNLWVVIAGLAICSSGVFVCQSVAKSYVGVVAKHGRSSASGLYVCFFYVGGSVGAILPGLVWSFGGWSACVALTVTVQLITGALALTFWRK
jgi:predicted MFS family arabinose efflux permease